MHIPIKTQYRVRHSDMEMPAFFNDVYPCGTTCISLDLRKTLILVIGYRSQESIEREE